MCAMIRRQDHSSKDDDNDNGPNQSNPQRPQGSNSGGSGRSVPVNNHHQNHHYRREQQNIPCSICGRYPKLSSDQINPTALSPSHPNQIMLSPSRLSSINSNGNHNNTNKMQITSTGHGRIPLPGIITNEIEEEMIFPMTDITEEDEEHYNSDTNNNNTKICHDLDESNLDQTNKSDFSLNNCSCKISNKIGISVPKQSSTGDQEEEEEVPNNLLSLSTTASSACSTGSSSWRSSSTKPNSRLNSIGGVGDDNNNNHGSLGVSLESNKSTSIPSSIVDSSEQNNKMVSSTTTITTTKTSTGAGCGSLISSSAPKSSGGGRLLNHLNLNIRCNSPIGNGDNGNLLNEDSQQQHYHTVHGTLDTNGINVNHNHQNNHRKHSPIERLFQSPFINGTGNLIGKRSRSNSGGNIFGPTITNGSCNNNNGFTQQVRHSALISAGMAVRNNGGSVLRRQSDTPGLDGNCHNYHNHSHYHSRNGSFSPSSASSSSSTSNNNCSRSHRTSPNNNLSFFDSFRPRSTSDGKSSKKSSVIAALKNNFLNRHSSSSASSCSTTTTVPSVSSLSVSTTTLSSTTSTTQALNNNNNNVNNNDITNGHHSRPSPSPLSTTTTVVNQQPTITTTTNENFSDNSQSIASTSPKIINHQPGRRQTLNCNSEPISAPISPNSVIDPFSYDYNLYVAESQHHHHHHSHRHHHHFCQQQSQIGHSRPRSRSGSASTMARVFDMIRGRSNSINGEQQPCCQQKPPFSHQDSICDRFEFEDIDENLVYVRFFKFYRCYDIIPISAKLVVFDTKLAVKKAFFALLSNGIRAAPLWDSTKHQFIGMLTITDFIHILRTYYHSPTLKMEKLEEHTVDNWRSMLKEKTRPMVSVEPDESLFNAIRILLHNKVHRLPVIDRDNGNVLYILTHKRILKFLFLFYYNRLPSPSYLHKSLRDLPQIGTFEKIATATPQTPLIDALELLVERRVSALPIVDKKNKVVDVYAKFDVIHLAADKQYQDLDQITIKKALEFRNQSERVVKCTMNETLHTIMERIVQAEVHRIIVVDQDDRVIGIISLSDLLNFLVIRPVNSMRCCSAAAAAAAANISPSPVNISPTIVVPTEMSETPLVEESGEEASICSHNDDSEDSKEIKKERVEDIDEEEERPEILVEEQDPYQLTVSSVGSSSGRFSGRSGSSSSSSSICNNNNEDSKANSLPPSSATATASNRMSSLISASKNRNALIA